MVRRAGAPAEQSEFAKLALLVGLTLAWLLPGLVGHEPWKGVDALTFGVVWSMLQTGDWLAPRLLGDTALTQPPLYAWVAGGLVELLSPPLAIHDAARLASGLFMALVFAAVGVAGRLLYGPGLGRPAVVALLGCAGLLSNGHEMQSELAALAGQAVGLAGLSWVRSQPVRGGVTFGIGLALAFLGGGLMAPLLLLAAAALALPGEAGAGRAAALGLAVGSVLCAPWLLAMAASRRPWLAGWLEENWASLVRLSAGNLQAQALHWLELISWFAWPVWLLALWTLWAWRRRLWRDFAFRLPLVFLLVAAILLLLAPSKADTLGLPLLLPLALFTAAGIDTLRRGAANALGWFGIMGMGAAAFFLWFAWAALLSGWPERFSAHLRGLVPGFEPRLEPAALGIAALLTVLWLVPLRLSFRSGRRALVHWAAGVTLVWGLLATLWLPALDHRRAHKGVFTAMAASFPREYRCLAESGMAPAHRALLYYYAGVVPRSASDPGSLECDLLIVQWDPKNGIAPAPAGWITLWEGARPGDKRSRFRLLAYAGHGAR